MNNQILNLVEATYLKSDIPEFRVGQTISVHVKIAEGGKERVQQFVGVVIARKGRGLTENFTVRRIVANQGVERTFLLHSPKIERLDVQRSGKVRRAKLYYLRERVGKARKLREKRVKRGEGSEGEAQSAASSSRASKADETELATVES
jgi:large subunit ribosomal protein L19